MRVIEPDPTFLPLTSDGIRHYTTFSAVPSYASSSTRSKTGLRRAATGNDARSPRPAVHNEAATDAKGDARV